MSMDYSGTPGEYIYSHNATGKSASGIIANGSTSDREVREAQIVRQEIRADTLLLIALVAETTQQILMRRLRMSIRRIKRMWREMLPILQQIRTTRFL